MCTECQKVKAIRSSMSRSANGEGFEGAVLVGNVVSAAWSRSAGEGTDLCFRRGRWSSPWGCKDQDERWEERRDGDREVAKKTEATSTYMDVTEW